MSLHCQAAENVVIVQNRNGHAIDWPAVVAGTDKRVHLVCDGRTERHVAERGWRHLFAEVHGVFPGPAERVKQAVIALVGRLGGPGHVIVCTNHEDDIDVCAAIREETGIAGPDTADVARFRNKLVMKERLEARPEWLPRYVRFDPRAYRADPGGCARRAVASLGLPMFAKPVDGAGSQGTRLLATEAELHRWAAGIGDDTVYELDELLRGTLYHCDFLVFRDQILDMQVARYLYPNRDFLLGKPLASITIPESEDEHRVLADFALQCLERFRPWPDGAIHLEAFRSPGGACRFLELACRAPGANIPALHLAQAGLDYRAAPYELVLSGALRRARPIAPHCATAWFPCRAGAIVGFRELRPAGSRASMRLLREPGPMQAATSFSERVAELLLCSDDYSRLVADFESLRDYYPAVLSGGEPAAAAGGALP